MVDLARPRDPQRSCSASTSCSLVAPTGWEHARNSALVLLGLIVVGNVVGLVLLIAALVTTRSSDIGGGQLLMTAAAIWVANVIVFGLCYWEVDDGGPFDARAHEEREAPDFQFPQDENPELARRKPWQPTRLGLPLRLPDERRSRSARRTPCR